MTDADETWRDAVAVKYPDEDDETRRGRILAVTELVRSLADSLDKTLPASMEPIAFRTVFGLEGDVVSRQIELEIPGELLVFLEWDMRGEDIAALYGSVHAAGFGLTALYTRETGKPATTGKALRRRNRDIAEISFFLDGFDADLIVTRHENMELRADKEIITGKTEYTMQSGALLGDDIILTMMLLDLTTASGAGPEYKRTFDRAVYLRGLGFDNREILKMTTKVTPGKPAFPPGLGDDVAVSFPASFPDDFLDSWLADVQVSILQGGYTILGRLPSIVAMYVLENWM